MLSVRIASDVLFLSKVFLPVSYHLHREDNFVSMENWISNAQYQATLYLLIKLHIPLVVSRGNRIWQQNCCFVLCFPFYSRTPFKWWGHLVLCHLPSQHWHRKHLMNGVSLAYLEIVPWKIKLQRIWLCPSHVSAPLPNSESEIIIERFITLDTRFNIS